MEDYFFAGRSLSFWALSITFIASWWGGGSALSTADLAFADGMGAFWYYGVPVLVATLLMGLGARAIRSVGYLTQGAMMEARYSRPVARLLALMILFFMLFSAASQMVAVGDFFGTFLGMGYEGGVLAGTLIVLVYSMFGGFRGVVLTDIIQFVLLLLSALAVFVVAMQECGALCSMLCGLAYCLYNLAIFLGMPLPAFWEQQSALQVILGVCLSLLVFTVTSLLDEPEYHKADAFLARTRQQAC